MNVQQATSLVIIPIEELNNLKTTQQEILQQLKELRATSSSIPTARHVTAKEFMAAVKICRTKFDQLVIDNKIKTIKKRRKIYVPAAEIERYFTDPTIL
ncbi:MAG: hypothetical protein WKF97_11425 [Chitinophagaceae bacterium]